MIPKWGCECLLTELCFELFCFLLMKMKMMFFLT